MSSASLKKTAGVTGRTDMLKVDPFAVQIVEGWNPRTVFDRDKLDQLKHFILANGIAAIPPIRVQKQDMALYLRDGQRRVTALRELITEGHPFDGMFAVIEPPRMPEADALVVAIGANQGEPLTPLDEAEAFSRLVHHYGWEASKIAEKLGKSRSYVSERLRLLEATPEVLEAHERGEVSLRDVVDVVRHADDASSQREQLARVQTAKAEKRAERKSAPREPRTFQETIWAYLEEYGVEAVESIIADYKQGKGLPV